MHPHDKVLILHDNGNNLGEMSYVDAQSLAQRQELDLVQVNKNDSSPVYKIMDYGKWKYKQKQKKKNAKNSTRQTKEMNFKINTAEHDLKVKINHIKKFLFKGHDVKVVVNMRGREKSQPATAREKLESILSHLENVQVQGTLRPGQSSVSVVIRSEEKRTNATKKEETSRKNSGSN